MPIRILIADDNAQVRAAMREVLEATGEWEVIEAEDGEQAVAKAQECLPRLVVLDLVMPVKDGLKASREIAELLPGVPVLMHTLYSSPQVQIEASRSGVRKVVPKSESATLISAVRNALDPAAGSDANSLREEKLVPNDLDRQRVEDRIRELCGHLAAAADDLSLETELAELRDALHEHVERFRARLLDYPAISERRSRNGVTQSEAAPETKNVQKNDATPKVLPFTDAPVDETPSTKPPSKLRNGTR